MQTKHQLDPPQKTVSIEIFSDTLCIWAYAAQARIDQLKTDYGEQIELHYRFIPIFAAAHQRIEQAWKDKGSYAGFNQSLQKSAAGWDHVRLNPDIWLQDPPESSQVAHLYLKALQLLESQDGIPADIFETFLWRVRCAFFEGAENISRLATLDRLAETLNIPCAQIHQQIDNGSAHAALQLDVEARDRYLVPGSPTLVFNDGRQRLYGNVGYRIIDANIRELLDNNHSGSASWC